jgi:hypothetical protein
MTTDLPVHFRARVAIAALLLATGAAAHALDLLKPIKSLFAADEKIVWQAPGQFVKIVEQDRIRKDRRPAKNSHPSDLTASQIATVLASLKVASAGKTVPIFTQAEVTLLAEKLADAFDDALPTQDVVFSIAGGQDGAAGHPTTAGRMFVQGARLQIIFGDVQQSAAGDPGNTSHHVEPHRAGKRKERIDKELVIADGPGVSYFSASDRERTDWILVDVPAVIAAWRGPAILPAAAPVPVAAPGLPPAPQAATSAVIAPAGTPIAPPGAAAVPPITAEQQRQLEERRQMAEEMARLRKQVQEQSGGGTTAAPAKPAGKSVEERLATLQSLHQKKLITDEEYEAKRKALLEEL